MLTFLFLLVVCNCK